MRKIVFFIIIRPKVQVDNSDLGKRSGKVVVSSKKALEIDGTWKQYSKRNLVGFFPVTSSRFSPEQNRNLIGSHLKKSSDIPLGVLLSYSIDFRLFLAGTSPYALNWGVDPSYSYICTVIVYNNATT
jgi:hypothetical protein